MLTYNVDDSVPQLLVDLVRLTPEAFNVIKEELKGEEAVRLGAFMAQYDWHTVILLHRGDELQHKAFMQRLNKLL